MPALFGVSAPYNKTSARGAFIGLSTAVRRPHLVRAVLEGVTWRIYDMMQVAILSFVYFIQPSRFFLSLSCCSLLFGAFLFCKLFLAQISARCSAVNRGGILLWWCCWSVVFSCFGRAVSLRVVSKLGGCATALLYSVVPCVVVVLSFAPGGWVCCCCARDGENDG